MLLIDKTNKADYFYLPFSPKTESFYNKLVNIKIINKILIGPCFVPKYWNRFPINKIWKERRFSEILKKVKGIVVHSNRVRDYLAKKSNISQDIITQFKIVRPCTNLKPKNISFFVKSKI